MERIFHLLLFLGLCVFSRIISCQYVLMQQQKNWTEAQTYCRQNHIDLATVQSSADWINLQDAVQPSLTSSTWIGLYNDINSWRWSYQDENVTLTLWSAEEPGNSNSKEECALLASGSWHDYPCNNQYRFICYNENGASRFVFISDFWSSWSEARSYCRQYYTDLAIIRTQTENKQLASMAQTYNAWIGLYRDAWKWSDGTSASSVNWMSGQPDLTGQSQPCAAIRPDGLTEDRLCSRVFPFICLTYSKKQIVKVGVKTGRNLNDPVVMGTVLQWMKQKLKDYGIEKDTRLSWRVRPDGNVFFIKA